MNAEPHLDVEHVESLLEVVAPDKVRALFESALRGAPPLLHEMREGASANDAEKLYRAGHTAKGMFGNLGMRRCEGLSRSIESLARAGQIAEADALMPALQTAVDETGALMMRWIDDVQASRSP
jgi:HPt (histidine-containing phosphotransfer) domain-containing protein